MTLKYSIIIPVKSINDYVRETVPNIQKLDVSNWELFIIPNDMEDNEWLNDDRIQVVASGRVGPADKRDLGARFASGDILVFLDDDSYPQADLLTVANQYFKDDDVIAIGGPGVTPPSDSFWQRVSGAVFLSRFTGGAPERYVPHGRLREVDDWPSVNLMVRRNIFVQVGGFDCKYWPGEDTKLGLKLKATGKKFLYVPEMLVWHHRRAGLQAHLKQIGAYGLHRGYFARHYPETSFRARYFAPSFFMFFCLMSWIIFSTLPEYNSVVLLGYGVYGLVLLLGFCETNRYESTHVALAALLYVPLTHLYYGIRFIQGFLKRSELKSTLR